MKLKVLSVIFLGASAMAFVALLLLFLLLLPVFGLEVADKVWSGFFPVVAWLIALLVCLRYMAR